MTTITINRAVEEQALHVAENAGYPLALIKALRAALAQQPEPTRSQKMADAGFTRRPSLWSLQARKALELIAAPQRPDGTWNRDREACRQLAAEALGRYDDE